MLLPFSSRPSRNDQLAAEVKRSPVVLSSLQQVLAGSVSVSVNAGPGEFCTLFLANADKFERRHVEALRDAFAEFLVRCREALEVNKRLVEANQHEFHRQMELDYAALQKKVLAVL